MLGVLYASGRPSSVKDLSRSWQTMRPIIRRAVGNYRLVPTLADDSGLVHAIVFTVNWQYRQGSIRERCLIVHRFRLKLSHIWLHKRPSGFEVRETHEDTFASELRSYDGTIGRDAVDFMSLVLGVNIVLVDVPNARVIRRGSRTTFDETIVIGWSGAWCCFEFDHGCILVTPGGDHPIMDLGL